MIRNFIYRLLERRHYWRDLSLTEMSELYASRLLRTLAISMVNIFIAIYLYQYGYGITFIMMYFCGYFLLRVMLAWPSAFFVARIGPKRTTFISNILYVPALLLFAVVPTHGLDAVIGAAVFQAVSVALYDISYLVGFSKVRNDENTGKELGYMHMLEQFAKGISPVVGGFTALWFGPQATLILASITFALAALPLFATPEQVKTHQKITFRGLQFKRIWGTVVAETTVGFDFVASGVMWSLLIALTVFGTSSNVIYAELGVLSSITIIMGVVAAKIFGLLVDKHRSRELLQTGVTADSVTHLLRLFAATPFSVLMINILNEAATTAYALPLTKALFAQADDLPGYRIAYMTVVSASAAFGAALFCSIIALISMTTDGVSALRIGYGIIAVCVFGLFLNRLPALRKRGFFR